MMYDYQIDQEMRMERAEEMRLEREQLNAGWEGGADDDSWQLDESFYEEPDEEEE